MILKNKYRNYIRVHCPMHCVLWGLWAHCEDCEDIAGMMQCIIKTHSSESINLCAIHGSSWKSGCIFVVSFKHILSENGSS